MRANNEKVLRRVLMIPDECALFSIPGRSNLSRQADGESITQNLFSSKPLPSALSMVVFYIRDRSRLIPTLLMTHLPPFQSPSLPPTIPNSLHKSFPLQPQRPRFASTLPPLSSHSRIHSKQESFFVMHSNPQKEKLKYSANASSTLLHS